MTDSAVPRTCLEFTARGNRLLRIDARSRRLSGMLWALAGAFLIFGWCAPGQAEETASRGDVLYHNYCSVCHGDRGDGQSRARNSLVPPPTDFTTPQAISRLTRERMLDAVRHGRPGTAMTAWTSQLSEPEIEAVVDYVRNFLMAAAETPDASRGRVAYARHCAVCHGDRGAGSMWAQNSLRPPPRDFTAPKAKMELTRQRMIAAVTHGRPETAMPGFGARLNQGEIEAVVSYITTAFLSAGDAPGISGTRARVASRDVAADIPGKTMRLPSVPTASPEPATSVADLQRPLPNELRGDPTRGGAFYMKNCAVCHGAKGDGQGPRAYFINPKPRNFLHPAVQHTLNRPALFQAIALGKRGTEMPAWNKVITDQEIADVAEFVFQSFITHDGDKTAQDK